MINCNSVVINCNSSVKLIAIDCNLNTIICGHYYQYQFNCDSLHLSLIAIYLCARIEELNYKTIIGPIICNQALRTLILVVTVNYN